MANTIKDLVDNKWHPIWGFEREQIGWHLVTVGLIKVKDLPPEGAGLKKPYYKGFFIAFRFWFPVERIK